MTEDPPADVLAVLTQLFEEGQEALAEGDHETARQTVTSAEEVVTNKLPEGEFRSRLLHGCARVRKLLDPKAGDADDDRPAVHGDAAAEYLAAMARRLPE